MGGGKLNIPEVGERGTFVQVDVLSGPNQEHYLEIGIERTFHRLVLGKLLKRLGIEFATKPTRDDYSIPLSSGDGSYRLVGAGRCSHRAEGKILFSGTSTDYEIGTDPSHLREFLPEFRQSGLRVFTRIGDGPEEELTESEEA